MANKRFSSKDDNESSLRTCTPFVVTLVSIVVVVFVSSVLAVSIIYNIKPVREPYVAPKTYPYYVSIWDIEKTLMDLETRGTRFVGTPASNYAVDWIEMRLGGSFCDVTREKFWIPVYDEMENPNLSLSSADLSMTLQWDKDFVQSQFGGSAPVTLTDAPISRLSTSGCDVNDWNTFPSGSIALVDLNVNIPNNCDAFQRALRAQDAHASAVIFRMSANMTRLVGPRMLDFPWHNTSISGTSIPVLMTSPVIGDLLFTSSIPFLVNLKTNSTIRQEETTNVYCTSRGLDNSGVVVVGASMDSVKKSPGINSNGSGFVSLVEIIKSWASVGFSSKNKFVFAFWNAGTLGSLGSSHYLDSLRSAGTIDSVKAYIDLNSISSINGVSLVASSFSPSLGPVGLQSRYLADFYSRSSKLSQLHVDVSETSSKDVAVFLANGIPAVGTTSGTYQISDLKQPPLPMLGNTPYSPCYDLPCDKYTQINKDTLRGLVQDCVKVLYQIATDGIASALA